MPKRIHKIVLDSNKSAPLFEINKLDSLHLEVEVTEVETLENAEVELFFKKSDGTLVSEIISEKEQNILKIDVKNGALDVPGIVVGQAKITEEDGNISSHMFKFNIKNSITSDDAIVNEIGIGAIEELKKQIDNAQVDPEVLKNKIEETINNGDLDVVSKEELQEINSQLDTIEKKKITTITPELFGAKGDGITDDTIALKKLITYAKLNNSTIEFFNKVYCISEELQFDFIPDIIGNKAMIKAIAQMENLISFNDVSFNYKGTLDNITLDGNNLVDTCLYDNSGRKRTVKNIVLLNSKNKGLYVKESYENLYSNIRIEDCPIGIQTTGTDAHYNDIFIRFSLLALDCKSGVNIWNNVHAWVDEDSYNGSIFAKVNVNQLMSNIYADSYETVLEITNNDANLTINGFYVFYNMENRINNPLIFKFNTFINAKVKISGAYFIDNKGLATFSDIPQPKIEMNSYRLVGINNVKTINENDIELSSGFDNIKSIIKKEIDIVSIVSNFSTSAIRYKDNFYQLFNISNANLKPSSTITLPCYSYSTDGHVSLHTITIGETSGNVGLKPQSDIPIGAYIYIDVRYLTNNDDIVTW